MPNFFRKADVKIAECWVTWRNVGPGVEAMLCFSPAAQYPVGTVYMTFAGKGQGGKSRAEILESHVVPWARRQGVRTLINQAIFRDWEADVIVTQAGTKEGEAFMRASGYEIDPNTGLWFLNRPKDAK